MKKYILSFVLAITVLLNTFVPFTYAQSVGPWYNQNPAQWYTKVYDDSNPQEIFGERYTAAQVQWVIYSILTFPFTFFLKPSLTACFLQILPLTSGGAPSLDLNSCFNASIGSAEGSSNLAISNTASQLNSNIQQKSLMDLLLEEKPVSGVSYFKNAARNLHIIPQAQAQVGFGYGALSPIQRLWTISRDTTYGIMILFILIMSFMIMFRTKVSPQAVITVQSALPKVVAALILITFSYAIAGFLVDLMYVVLGLFSLLISTPFNANASVLFAWMTGGPANTGIIGVFVLYFSAFLLTSLFVLVTTVGLTGFAAFGALTVVTAGGAAAVAAIILLLMIVILFVMALWNGMKTIWTLVKTFATILLLIIFAPYQIAVGLVYGGAGFGSWLKSLASNLAVFVVTNVLIVFSFIFLIVAVGISAEPFSQAQDINALLGNLILGTGIASIVDTYRGVQPGGFPPLVSFSVEFIFLATSFVLFSMIPKAADITKSVITGKPLAYGSAITGAIPGFGFGSTVATTGASGGFAGGAQSLWNTRNVAVGPNMNWRNRLGTATGAARASAASAIQKKTGI